MKEEMQNQPPVLMVMDIGGSKYMPGFIDGEGNILYQERLEWTSVEPDAIVEQMKAALHGICDSHPELARRAEAGGLTIPGFADPITGVWVESDFLVVKDLPICGILSEEFGIPFYADNDGNACALAERYFGGAKEQDTFLYLTVSTGIGGALYLNDELYYGSFWHAGEIGLFVVEEYGRPSDTGSVNGIVEMYASGRGFAQNYLEAGGKKLIDGKTPGGPEISRLAKEGDETALRTLELEGKYLGRIIANACTMADFGKVILGGGLSLLFEQYKDALYAEFSRILPNREVEIEATQLGYSGAFLGAAAVAVRGRNGFDGSLGAGQPEKCIFHVNLKKTAECFLELEGHVCECKEAVFGSFLTAVHIETDGPSLDQVLGAYNMEDLAGRSKDGDAEAYKDLAYIGNKAGKAVAAACVLLDPGKVIVEGCVTGCDAFRDSFLETVKRETYYRGNLPFVIQYE